MKGWAIESLASLSTRLAEAEDLDLLLDVALATLAQRWGLHHAMLLVVEGDSDRLVTLASRGYDQAGVGSEVVIGTGVIGVAAERRLPVRIANLGYAMRYARAARDEAARTEAPDGQAREIPLPGLPDVQSQLAVPMLARGRLVGVLYVESVEAAAFDEGHERCLTVLANQIAAGIALESPDRDATASPAVAPAARDCGGDAIQVRYYREDGSVFIDGAYLIKSLPGRILWRLLTQLRDEGRSEFTNRELRLDAALELPAVKDNLETRLILLRRRLEERSEAFRIVKAGRGRFSLEVAKPFDIQVIDG